MPLQVKKKVIAAPSPIESRKKPSVHNQVYIQSLDKTEAKRDLTPSKILKPTPSYSNLKKVNMGNPKHSNNGSYVGINQALSNEGRDP